MDHQHLEQIKTMPAESQDSPSSRKPYEQPLMRELGKVKNIAASGTDINWG